MLFLKEIVEGFFFFFFPTVLKKTFRCYWKDSLSFRED